MSSELYLRPTQLEDLAYVQLAERAEENRPFILPWTWEEHRAALKNPDLAHLIVQHASTQQAVGFAILAGLTNPHHSIELRRIVITEKSKGYGKQAIEQIKANAFHLLHAHRLWLDVKQSNQRAQSLYQQAEFVVEGTLRECLRNADVFESLVVMSILAHEYKPLQ